MSIVSLAISLAIGELTLRLVAPVPDPYERYAGPRPNKHIPSQFPPNTDLVTKTEEGLPGVAGVNRFTTNSMGFRGDDLVRPKPPNEFRIFMVGGSSTECFYLDDHQAIHSVLQNELENLNHSRRTIKVYNAGKSGDRSDDHVSMIAHRIVHLEPDMLIVFAGINDLRAMIRGFDYLHSPELGMVERPSLSFLMGPTISEVQVGRRLYYLLKRVLPRKPEEVLREIPLISDYKERIRIRINAPVTDEKPMVNTKPYRTNLTTIAGLAWAHHVKLVFITQQTTWNSKVDPRTEQWQWMLYLGGKTYRADIMDAVLESLNDEMRKVAAEQGIPLYDLRKVMPKSTDFFYDDVHFNVKGALTAGKGLAEFISSRGLTSLRPPVSESRLMPIARRLR